MTRSNIKTEKYDAIAQQFRTNDIPLYVDLMMGLPGQRYAGFVDDLQAWCEARLSRFKCPRQVRLVDDLARNALGKLDKRALREGQR